MDAIKQTAESVGDVIHNSSFQASGQQPSQNALPSKMKAGIIEKFNSSVAFQEGREVPGDLKGHDILVQVKAAGMCHTDLQVLQGVYASQGSHEGMIGSHEPAGVVVALGPEAMSAGKVKVGSRVGSINTFGFCGKCKACKANGPQLCENVKGLLGLTIDGGFAQYAKMDARVVGLIPESIPFDQAAPLFCAGATIYGALKAVGIEKGKWLAIVGLGGLGHLGVQYAKALGFKVVALDNRQEALDLLKEAPANLRPDQSYLMHDDEKKNEQIIQQLGSGFYDSDPGVDKAILCAEARHLPRVTQQFLRKGGIICDVGLPADGPLEVDAFALSFKEQTIRGRLICTPKEAQEVVDLHAREGCRTHIEKAYPIEEIKDVYKHYESKDLKGRIVVTFD
ncbi:Alcohol dehydrogenase, class V [Ceraceosorus bombacis]|uniref:Alcohol dehydrogenase, class V n=1 Tax=Ceraceosorus bombacis TaxID=401625 RepID=A0A0P1BKT3_9BASI|nr:Alcohol dehydrogenase, class V [Ceraceosorus bombacis]